jgi:mono/diheme cytochrome c family protein
MVPFPFTVWSFILPDHSTVVE